MSKMSKMSKKEVKVIIDTKIDNFKKVIQNIIKNVNINYNIKLITINEYNTCYENAEKILNLINSINYNDLENEIQYINNMISVLIKNYGTFNFQDIIEICLDKEYNKIDKIDKYLQSIFFNYARPLKYNTIKWPENFEKHFPNKYINKNTIIDNKIILEDTYNYESFDIITTTQNFNLKINGLTTILHDLSSRKTLIIVCLIDDIIIETLDYNYIAKRKNNMRNYLNNINIQNNDTIWNNYIMNLSLRELLVYNDKEIVHKYLFVLYRINEIEKLSINEIVTEFLNNELFVQRNTIIYLLTNSDNYEFLYISYLLYDLLSNENSNYNDTREQQLLFNSLPWNIKKKLKNAMIKTIEYTNNLSKINISKVSLEQQICLMKVNDNVKEKAIQKLKEIKSSDTSHKSRQYLDGLLSIPFGIYKIEDIFNKKNSILSLFHNLKENIKYIKNDKTIKSEILVNDLIMNELIIKDISHNNVEISNMVNYLNSNNECFSNIIIDEIKDIINKKKKYELIVIINNIKLIEKNYKLDNTINISSNKINLIRNSIIEFIEINKENSILITDIEKIIVLNINTIISNVNNLNINLSQINKINDEICKYIKNINTILDKSVYGHKNAKKHIQRIIGQWINGENSGYCFGFEGPPGIGKTSLAKKGIVNCLQDNNGVSRPFAFIALGGSSNGSLLEGHNYTYVGSTWGKIVDILISSKCLNPIIFIDELDKVSKTEHGREIIGILTHLTDSTQNTNFQDKYFSNIDIDLSKALFIFSYNDPELIDKILLDRIHRIKFEILTVQDKLIIASDYIIPEICKQMGLTNIILFTPEIITKLINYYTNEPGVRKLRQIIYDIISTINLNILEQKVKYELPILITDDMIISILYDYNTLEIQLINSEPNIGIINGLWANSQGKGGMLQIETSFFATKTFMDLKLTGMQGDVMRESMAVAKTLAWSLLTQQEQEDKLIYFEKTKNQGIHIHVPEGATPKDGPSAGSAITMAIYSLLTNRKIKNDYALTGEICLQGKVTQIGGLDLKIIGGIRSGVKNFIYPKSNYLDFKKFYKKYKSIISDLENINFIEADNIIDIKNHIII